VTRAIKLSPTVLACFALATAIVFPLAGRAQDVSFGDRLFHDKATASSATAPTAMAAAIRARRARPPICTPPS
jgi:hypothetical protein